MRNRQQTAERPETRRLGWAKKLGFAFVPTLLLLLVVEGLCRLWPQDPLTSTNPGYVEPDPDLIWRLKPTLTGPLATNELGFRDTPYQPDADLTILLLGDSVAWGEGVIETKQCFPHLLEKKLNDTGRWGTVEVINASVPGYSTFQELKYLELHGFALQPDLVVLVFCLNDVVERYLALAEYGGDDSFLGIDTRRHIPGAVGWGFRRSRAFERFYRLLQHTARRGEEYAVEGLASDTLSDELQRAWDRALEEIEKIRVVTAGRHIPLVLAIAPYRFQLDDPEGKRQPQARLLEYAAGHVLPCVDLLPVLVQGTWMHTAALFGDASHFTVAGHRVAADALAAEVESVLMQKRER
ncbi:MAG: SGNH/GDSL hydrolase family protein [Planctomycetota bacterium]